MITCTTISARASPRRMTVIRATIVPSTVIAGPADVLSKPPTAGRSAMSRGDRMAPMIGPGLEWTRQVCHSRANRAAVTLYVAAEPDPGKARPGRHAHRGKRATPRLRHDDKSGQYAPPG